MFVIADTYDNDSEIKYNVTHRRMVITCELNRKKTDKKYRTITRVSLISSQ